jgi:hypothetical protein
MVDDLFGVVGACWSCLISLFGMSLGYAAHISVRCIFVLESGNFSFFTCLTHSSAVFRVVSVATGSKPAMAGIRQQQQLLRLPAAPGSLESLYRAIPASIREDWLQYLHNGAHYSEAGFVTPFGPPPTRVRAPPSVGGQIARVEMMGPAAGASIRKLNQSLGL